MNTSLVIIQYGDLNLLTSLISSLKSHPDKRHINEIVVVNNGSPLTNSAYNQISNIDISIQIVNNPKASYASGVNKGVRATDSEFVIVSNNDVEWIDNHSIVPALLQLSRNQVGIVGPQQVYKDGKWQRSYDRVPSVLSALESVLLIDTLRNRIMAHLFKQDIYWIINPEYIDGAFMCIDTECFESVGGFNEQFDFYGEDAAFCQDARDAGWTILSDTRARIMHLRGASSSMNESRRYASQLLQSKRQYVQMYSGTLACFVFTLLQVAAILLRLIAYNTLSKLDSRWDSQAKLLKNKFYGVLDGAMDR